MNTQEAKRPSERSALNRRDLKTLRFETLRCEILRSEALRSETLRSEALRFETLPCAGDLEGLHGGGLMLVGHASAACDLDGMIDFGVFDDLSNGT